MIIGSGLCDLKIQPCKKIRFLVTNILDSEGLVCITYPSEVTYLHSMIRIPHALLGVSKYLLVVVGQRNILTSSRTGEKF